MNELRNEINECEEMLNATIAAFENLRYKMKEVFPNESGRLRGVLDSYTIPSLRNWLESEHQCGSLSDIKKGIEQELEFDDEDEGEEE